MTRSAMLRFRHSKQTRSQVGKRRNAPKSQQHEREDEHMPAMNYGLGSVGALGLNLVSEVIMGVNGRLNDGMNDDPPMASLGPPPG